MESNQNPTRTRMAEQHFRMLIESVTDYAFITFDERNRVTNWSRGAEQILGYTEQEALGLAGAEFFTPEDRANGAPEIEIETSLREGRAEDKRWHLKRDGTRFWASGVMTPLRNEQGELQGFAKVFRDLTESKRAEEESQQNQARQAFLFSLQDRLQNVAGDPDAIRDLSTNALASFLGVPRVGYADVDETVTYSIVRNNYTDGSRMPGVTARVDRLDDYGPALIRELRAGRIVRVDDLATDPRTVGSPAEAHAAVGARAALAVPIQHRGQTVAFLFAHDDRPHHWTDAEAELAREVAGRTWTALERAWAEARLRASEERFRLFVENVREYALFQLDPEGRISSWNPGAERLFGYTESDVLGQPITILFMPEDQATRRPLQELAHALAEGQAEDARWLRRRDGSRLWAQWVTHAMYDHSGGLRGFAKVLRDETAMKLATEERERIRNREREQLKQQVQASGTELDRTKEELRALAGQLMMAQEEERRRIARELHDDLAQRLAALELGLTSLQMRPPEDLTQLAARIAPLSDQVGSLSDEVRSLSHSLHPSMLEHLGLLSALRGLVNEVEKVHGIPIRFRADELPRTIPMPIATAVFRIAQEALRNVVKHGLVESPVSLLVTDQQGTLQLTVQDYGPGFDPKTVRVQHGLGIISMQERAWLVGGTLEIQSEPGAGTTVRAIVPWKDQVLPEQT